MTPTLTKPIHLLYVPTLACNLECRYCYLGKQTERKGLKQDAGQAAATLRHALNAFERAGVLLFNVSLHGGEPTMLPREVLDELFSIINRHYLEHFDELTARGYRKSSPHIKTNLFNFHTRYDLFAHHRVSISASIDLPLALHEKYRMARDGRSWLQRTLKNLRLLASYPHSTKISSTFYQEHLQDIPAIIADIWTIHREIGFDMNNFNIMFGFESALNREKFGELVSPVSEEQQLALYEALKDEFAGTDLEYGLRRNWFDEFKPSYCTNAFNCGERFYLLQGDGSVWSCVRGQGLDACYYGNILKDPVEQILMAGQRQITLLHQQAGMAEECRGCDYLHLCHTGCPVVKLQKGMAKSYTCALQKRIYLDNPASYPPAANKEKQRALSREYLLGMHPGLTFQALETQAVEQAPDILLPNDLYQQKNSLAALISADSVLQQLYDAQAIWIQINNDESERLESQLIKSRRSLYVIAADDLVVLHVKKTIFTANCSELIRNTIHLQMLRDTTVMYGDEQRSKQEHLFTYQIFHNLLATSTVMGEDYVMADITGILRLHRGMYKKNVLNNLFITTGYLREYHYQKQKANAFYHIQAMNLPFHNIEFYWLED